MEMGMIRKHQVVDKQHQHEPKQQQQQFS
ncbi:unnamed protein product, partial [Rotaria socialis]